MYEIIKIANEPISDKEKEQKIRNYLSEQLLDPKAAAEYMNISHVTFYNRVHKGEIQAIADRYLKSDLEAYLQKDKIDRNKVNHRYASKSNATPTDFKKSGFLVKLKKQGKIYVYIKKGVTVPGKGQRHKTIHSFGPLPEALKQLQYYLDTPNEIPSTLTQEGFDRSDIKKWHKELSELNSINIGEKPTLREVLSATRQPGITLASIAKKIPSINLEQLSAALKKAGWEYNRETKNWLFQGQGEKPLDQSIFDFVDKTK